MSFEDRLERHDHVASTMAVARKRALEGAPEGTTVSARTQTDGRGRRGRSWFSPAGGLYMTTLLRPVGVPVGTLPQLALVAGLAVRAACEGAGAKAAKLKWPNDVVVGRKKLAGTLVETLEDGSVLIGIGLNLEQRGDVELPEDLSLRFIGLADLVEGQPEGEEVAQTILRELESRYRLWGLRGFMGLREEFGRFDALAGTEVRAQIGDGWLQGTAEGLDQDGALLIHTQNRVERVSSGEVRYVRPGT